MAFWRNVDCWIFVPDQGRLPLLDCKEGFRISRWPHSCLEKALPASAEPHELPNPFICHSQRAGWDERKRGPGFLVGFSKPDHHAFTRLHSTQIPERKCCMKSMLSLVTIYHEGKIQMFQCLSLKFEWEFHNQSRKKQIIQIILYLHHLVLDRKYQHKLTHISMSRVPRSKQFFEKNYVPVQKKDWAVTVGL